MEAISSNGQAHYNNCRFCSADLAEIKNLMCIPCERKFKKKRKHDCNKEYANPGKWETQHVGFCCKEHEVIYYNIRRDIEYQFYLDKQNKREFTEDELKTFRRIQDVLTNNK